jgi:hypothetical protein
MKNETNWIEIEVAKFTDEMDAEYCIMENINYRRYTYDNSFKKFVVLEAREIVVEGN